MNKDKPLSEICFMDRRRSEPHRESAGDETGIKSNSPTSLDDLWTIVEEAWHSVPVERCQTLVESIARRCAGVLTSNGYSTEYL
ncbi:hypothetical protein Trydic_g8300 [Trypoxylus dichotomus]